MRTTEKIPVFIEYKRGRTVCICHAANKGCGKRSCVRDTVTRDKFEDWQKTMKRNKYGI